MIKAYADYRIKALLAGFHGVEIDDLRERKLYEKPEERTAFTQYYFQISVLIGTGFKFTCQSEPFELCDLKKDSLDAIVKSTFIKAIESAMNNVQLNIKEG
jgi:hypothetical protein